MKSAIISVLGQFEIRKPLIALNGDESKPEVADSNGKRGINCVRVDCQMAKPKVKKQEQQAPASAQVDWDVKADTPSYYVNFIGVSHSPYEFTLSVARIQSPLTHEQAELVKSGQKIPVEPILQLLLPPLVVDGLINALIDQKVRHEQTLAQQVKNNEKQQYLKPSGTVH